MVVSRGRHWLRASDLIVSWVNSWRSIRPVVPCYRSCRYSSASGYSRASKSCSFLFTLIPSSAHAAFTIRCRPPGSMICRSNISRLALARHRAPSRIYRVSHSRYTRSKGHQAGAGARAARQRLQLQALLYALLTAGWRRAFTLASRRAGDPLFYGLSALRRRAQAEADRDLTPVLRRPVEPAGEGRTWRRQPNSVENDQQATSISFGDEEVRSTDIQGQRRQSINLATVT